MTAYIARKQRNNDALLKLAKKVIEIDSSIEVYHHKSDKQISSLTFFKGEEVNGIGFHEVPYRWSGCGYTEHGKSHKGKDNLSIPFDLADVLTSFHPITDIKHRQPNEYFESKEQYLKWCSYLKKYSNLK